MKCARTCKRCHEARVKWLLKLMGANRGTLLDRSWRELSGALTALPIFFVLVLQRCGVGEMLEVRIYGVHLLA